MVTASIWFTSKTLSYKPKVKQLSQLFLWGVQSWCGRMSKSDERWSSYTHSKLEQSGVLAYFGLKIIHFGICARKTFSGLNQNSSSYVICKSIFPSILKVSNKFIEKYTEEYWFWWLIKMVFSNIWPFLCFSGDKMVSLDPIDF